MKRKLKAFTLAALTVLIFSVFVLGISAEEGNPIEKATEISDTGTVQSDSATGSTEEKKENIFTSAFAFFEENISEIFSLLSFKELLILLT